MCATAIDEAKLERGWWRGDRSWCGSRRSVRVVVNTVERRSTGGAAVC